MPLEQYCTRRVPTRQTGVGQNSQFGIVWRSTGHPVLDLALQTPVHYPGRASVQYAERVHTVGVLPDAWPVWTLKLYAEDVTIFPISHIDLAAAIHTE